MRRTRLWPLGLVGLGAVLVARCSGSGGDAPTLARCEVDLSAWTTVEGSGARAQVATTADLLAGEAALGRAGDVLLANDRLQVLIEQPGRTIGPQPFGGNIIDADIVRPGEPARDRFGELGALIQLGRTMDAERVEILRDGSGGGAAVVAATGRDAVLDFINLSGLLSQFLASLKLPDSNRDYSLRITTYYVLAPGRNAVNVVQAFCNDTDTTQVLAVGDLVDSGGQVEAYGGRSGFGAGAAGGPSELVNSLNGSAGDPFVAWVGEDVTYGYVPDTDQNQVVTIAGVTGTLLGGKALLDWTKGEDAEPPQGALILDPKGSGVVARDFVVAAEPGAVWSHYYAKLKVATGTLSGVVRDAAGALVAGARVQARIGTKAVGVFTTDAAGAFSGQVPVGNVLVSADDFVGRTPESTLAITAGATAEVTLTMPGTATLTVHLRANGEPGPGKVTVICDPTCEASRTGDEARRFRDVGRDAFPKTALGETFAYRYVGPEGEAAIVVPPGKYRVFVSRGPEWTLFEEAVEVEAGGVAAVTGELAHVAPTPGWTSGDFHVHAINSPDSPIANVERLRSFLAEGVDVIVSTDHDYVTDFAPFLAQIPDGDKYLRNITGVELTTFDYGHYNAFPLVADPSQRNGGAVDWAGARGPGMTPGDIMEALQAPAGEQVVQLNHASSSFFSAVGLDTRTLWTRSSHKAFRIRDVAGDPVTGDTRLFDDRFTALEIQNGFGDNFFPLLNDWFAMLSRGLRKTGTAVSDTHKRHGNSGNPRTYVRTGTDDPKTLDIAAYASAINAGRAVGTNGPFVKLTARVAEGAPAEVGDTLVVVGGEVTVDVEVRSPAWLEVNELKLFLNAEGTAMDADGKAPRTLPAASKILAFDHAIVRENGHDVRVATVSTTLPVTKDGWLVGYVSGTKDLFPVIGKGNVTARAFTNPIYLDVGGDGWTPPVSLAAERARVGSLRPAGQPLSQLVTEAELRAVFGRGCSEDEP